MARSNNNACDVETSETRRYAAALIIFVSIKDWVSADDGEILVDVARCGPAVDGCDVSLCHEITFLCQCHHTKILINDVVSHRYDTMRVLLPSSVLPLLIDCSSRLITSHPSC